MGLTAVLRGVARAAPWPIRRLLRILDAAGCAHWRLDDLAGVVCPLGVPVTVGDVTLCVPGRARTFYRSGFEPLTREAFRVAIRPGDRVLDIGANAGYYSVLAARLVGPAGHVDAVEPSPANLPILRANLAGMTNVTLHAVGAGSATADLPMHLSPDTLNDTLATPYTTTTGSVRVPVRRLDDLIDRPPTLIKMDIQGFEPAALIGMQRLLRDADRCTLVVEWEPRCLVAAGYTPDMLPDVLRELGLTIVRIIPHTEDRDVSLEDALRDSREHPEGIAAWNLIAVKP